jgi:predicted ATPase
VAFQHGGKTFAHLASAAMPKPVSSSPTSLSRTASVAAGRSSIASSATPLVSRLPAYRTRWIGAEWQAARLQALIREQRLVTVLGPGGCGKTRLAVEVARLSVVAADRRAEEPSVKLSAGIFERALFVGLIGCVGATDLLQRLAPVVAAALVQTPASAAAEDADEAQGRILLLLDNCEQLDGAATQQIALLAEHMPQAHCLLTSRRPMGLDGEHEFMMSGLGVPSSVGAEMAEDSVAELAINAAVSLFLDRARAHRADVEVLPANSHDLVTLVRCLDGLPLAIELAASHARTLNPAQMLALLRAATADAHSPDSGLKWLARRGQRSGHDGRHASMWQVIEESWRMLSPAAQALLQAWCDLPGGAEPSATWVYSSADALDELLAHAMLQTSVRDDGALKHRVGELVRAYVTARRAGRDSDVLQI